MANNFMLNRHSIRKKMVFAVYQEYILCPTDLQKSNILQTFRYYCAESEQILVNIVDLLLQISAYAYEDLSLRNWRKSHKSLQPNFSVEKLRSTKSENLIPKLAQNQALIYLTRELGEYRSKGGKNQANKELARLFDEDIIKRLFYTVTKSKEYQHYISLESPNSAYDASIVKFILTQVIMQDEVLEDILEANFLMAYEDAQLACNYLLKNLRNWQENSNNNPALIPNSKQYDDFALEILTSLEREYEVCQKMIFPKIQHWEEHRICCLDKVLLLLGLCEILYYNQVPVRVAINEYIEIAKEYSTEKSKNFINGILDALLKELVNQDKILPTRL